jgi:hypothetical protein
MTVKVLASANSWVVLRGNTVIQDGVSVKARCNNFSCKKKFQLTPSKDLVMEDLIQNVDILFDDKYHPPSPPVPSPDMTETMSTLTYGSFFSPGFPHPTEVQAMGTTTRHRPTFAQLSFSSLPLDAAMESHLSLAPSPNPLLSPLLGFPSSRTLIPEVRDSEAVETLPNSTLAEVVSVPPTSVAEWRLSQSRLPPHHPEAVTIPQSPPESVLSSTSDFARSSVTSLQTRMGFSP